MSRFLASETSKHIGEKDLEKSKKILQEHNISVLSLHQPILTLYRIDIEGIPQNWRLGKI